MFPGVRRHSPTDQRGSGRPPQPRMDICLFIIAAVAELGNLQCLATASTLPSRRRDSPLAAPHSLIPRCMAIALH